MLSKSNFQFGKLGGIAGGRSGQAGKFLQEFFLTGFQNNPAMVQRLLLGLKRDDSGRIQES